MQIDIVSEKIVTIALYLDSLVPGSVSEIWIGEEKVIDIKKNLPNDVTIVKYINEAISDVDKVRDSRRRQYLREVLHSLTFQLDQLNKKTKSFSYAEFSKNVFGYEIHRITQEEIFIIQEKIAELEKSAGKTRQEVFLAYSLKKNEYIPFFKKSVLTAEQALPFDIVDFPDNGFEYEATNNEPWTAFNSHVAPFKSKLILNTDITMTKLELQRLAYHEAYGGHHAELSHKDILLTKEGHGEHGLVITFSPQTFISEAIAESIYVFFAGIDENSTDHLMAWYYDRLIFALYNLATHLHFEDRLRKDEIKKELEKYAVSSDSIDGILGFSLDSVYGKYSPVYYSAYTFLENIYSKSANQEILLKSLFTKPCTPKIISQSI